MSTAFDGEAMPGEESGQQGARQKWWSLIDFFWIRTGRFRKKYLLSLQTINIGVRRGTLLHRNQNVETRAALEYQLNWISSALPVLGDDQIFFSVASYLLGKNVSTSEWSLVANSKPSNARNGGERRAVTPVRNMRKIVSHRIPEASSDEYLAEICLEIFFTQSRTALTIFVNFWRVTRDYFDASNFNERHCCALIFKKHQGLYIKHISVLFWN